MATPRRAGRELSWFSGSGRDNASESSRQHANACQGSSAVLHQVVFMGSRATPRTSSWCSSANASRSTKLFFDKPNKFAKCTRSQ